MKHSQGIPGRRWRRIAPAAAVLAAGLVLAASCIGARDGTAVAPARSARATPLSGLSERLGALSVRGAVTISGDDRLGGLSGLVVTDGGRRFTAVADIGRLASGRLLYDAAGRLTGVADVTVRRLPGSEPKPDRPRRDDSEELAALPDGVWPGGGWLVSFERDHRIQRYRADFGDPVELPTPPGLLAAPPNSGIEALAVLPDGRVLALEEGHDNGRAERHGWIGTPPLRGAGDWSPLTYRAAPGFRPSGATVMPSGDVLVLERAVSLLTGWRARIVRVPRATPRAGAVVEGEELARLERPLPVDNFEGISAIPGPGGETLIYVVSDDNFSPLQSTMLYLFALPGG